MELGCQVTDVRAEAGNPGKMTQILNKLAATCLTSQRQLVVLVDGCVSEQEAEA